MSTHGRPRRARSAPLKMREAVSAGDVDAFLGPDDNNDSDSSDGAEAPPAISERLRFEPPGFEGMSDQDLRDELVNKWGYAEILLKGPGREGWTRRENLVGWLRKVRQKPLQQRKELTSAEPDEGILVESPAAVEEARALAADPAAIREAYARERQDAGSERAPSQTRKKSEQKGCGGTRPEARNKLLEPLGDGTGRLGLACCVARGVIKYGSLRCMTIEKLDDYVSRGKAVYEHLGPKSKPKIDFAQRLEAELKFKNQTRYFYGSMCHCHLDNVTSLLHRVEKKLSSAAPGAAQTPGGRARGAKMTGGGTKRQKVEKVEKVESPSATSSATDEDNDSTSDGIVDQAVYDRSPFGPGQLVLVPANAFGDDYADENPETLPGTLLSIKHVELDEAGEERRIWDVRYETGPFETDESFFVRRVSIGRGRRARGFERRSRRRRGHRAQEAAAAGHD